MINYTYNLNQHETIKNYRENIYLRTETKILDGSLNINNLLNLKIKRHIHNDSTILEINYKHITDQQLVIGVFINNKPLPISKIFTNEINFSMITGLNKLPKFDFEEVNHISVVVYKVNNNKMTEYLNSHIEIRHNEINKTFNLDNDHQSFDIPLEFEFEIYSGNYDQVNDDKIIKNIKYARIILINEKLNPYKYFKNIYYIAANIVDKNNKISKIPIANLSDLKAKVTALPDITEAIDCNFDLLTNNQKFQNYDIVGKLTLNTHSYYDFNLNKTIQGFNINSQDGYIIPYNFKGIFSPILILSINNKYKNIVISKIYNIKHPLLNPTEGNIKLKISEDVEIKNRLNWMSFDNIAILNIIENQYTLDQLVTLSREAFDKIEENNEVI
ncbi:MHO_1580 family protein [Mycoplasma miroungirhinis]|uniref:Uncharacterized protein n=1 Tax=Mycoplasma miroungirhinis TaxID=754516 RepID=A0A6M4JD61_9MOLU|nr:hypothetical protein [Mycoplasma miroungirhinis]QJR44017.1 hypothetical protein HLA92_01010 [Mycoplasma miroungirhinis]